MSTKFVSKNSNYMVVLKPGVEGNRALGTHAVSGLYVKFQAGVVDVKEESVTTLLRAHPCFGTDFLEVKENEVDPFVETREEVEPTHFTTEMKYGHAEKTSGPSASVKMTPAMKKVIEKEAIKMLPNLLKSNPKVLKEIILGLATEMKADEAKAGKVAGEETTIAAKVEEK